jgi:hypothetical protein
MFRRKSLSPDLAERFVAFQSVLEELEPAKAGLTDVLPGTRMPGRPLDDALVEFERRLERARTSMPAWRHPDVETEWVACEEGVGAALDLARRAREDAPDVIGFEGLLGLVEELMDPLDPFVAAEERFRGLRR